MCVSCCTIHYVFHLLTSTASYSNVFDCRVFYLIVLCLIILYCTMLCRILFDYILLHCILLCSIALYSILFYFILFDCLVSDYFIILSFFLASFETEQSRRDDLESLGYVLTYFLRGSLPWQGLKGTTKKLKYELILEKKISTTTDMLCKGFPAEFRSYFEHIRSLGFDDRPDYDYLKRLFRELFFRKGFTYDNMYDWELLQMNGKALPSEGVGSGSVAGKSTGDVSDGDGLGGKKNATATHPMKTRSTPT